MKVRILPVLALGIALTTAGCQNPDGSTNWGNTLALGAGLGVAAGAVAAAASDDGPRYRQPPHRHHGSYRGYQGGHGGRYAHGRGWR
ncbi:hypothetical protein [Roseomonas xinghualingensis]|uniref:hypothetical protein n=1 Tax=Roseomonas xinghualingensis TaxID=2986475 RepID=UPI0021F0FA56|nr:hypothetical protein [Roseomonas sp. SXEYE001]MCV4208628.1 hypothetical protein [Roseomonas sp. SXEYE001]